MVLVDKKKKSYSINSNNKLERIAGIEPVSSAWKAEVLPLNDIRNLKKIISQFIWHPSTSPFRGGYFGAYDIISILAGVRGFEPLNVGVKDRCLNHLTTPQ